MRGLSCGLLVVLAAGVTGCEDLTLANSAAHEFRITPYDTLVTEGDQAKFTITVLDERGNVVPGPPGWAPARWIVQPPVLDIEPDGSYRALSGGNPRVRAQLAGLQAETYLRVNPLDVQLTVAAIYFNQAAQNLEGTVPVMAGRPALLRVFPVGDETSFFEPRARVRLYLDGEEVHAAAMNPVAGQIPTKVNEMVFDRSFDTIIPGSIVRPGLQMVIELDPDGVVPAAPGSRLRIPESGLMDVDVVTLPVHIQTVVPTIHTQHPNEAVLDWTNGLTAESPNMADVRALMPVADVEVVVHDPFYSDTRLEAGGGGWQQWLREITLLWEIEGRVGYYYGVANLPYGSGVVGMGNLPPRGTLAAASVGRPNRRTFAHEVGHSMSLRHAPCGGAGGPDPNYPYSGGSIGIVGYDVTRQAARNPQDYSDLMSYCRPYWISDFSLGNALTHRILTENPVARAAWEALPEERALILWGAASEKEFLLEPAFLVEAKPRTPTMGGPYRLEGFGEDGVVLFNFNFMPTPVEDGGAHFNFLVPYDPDRDGALERVVLSGPEGEFTLGASGTRPMAIIINRDSGQVRAMLRDWRGAAAVANENTEILVSDGLPRRIR